MNTTRTPEINLTFIEEEKNKTMKNLQSKKTEERREI